MQTFAIRRSVCRHILFTAPAGCLQGKLNPFPLCASTPVLVCKGRQASFPLKQHHAIKVHTSRTTASKQCCGFFLILLVVKVKTSKLPKEFLITGQTLGEHTHTLLYTHSLSLSWLSILLSLFVSV